MAGKRGRSKVGLRELGKQSASRRRVAVMDREKEGGGFAKHRGGMGIEQHRQGQKKKANSEMKGVIKKRMWVVLGKKEKEKRGREND